MRKSEHQLEQEIQALTRKIGDMKSQAAHQGRKLNSVESRLVGEMVEAIDECRIELELHQPQSKPLTVAGISNGSTTTREAPSNGPAKDRTFRGMFYPDQRNVGLDMAGWASSGEFLDVLNSGRHDPRLIRATHVESVPSSGGFSVPEQMTAQWLDSSLPTEIIRSRATVWPMTSSTRKIPGWDDFDQSSGAYFGGLSMQFLAEAGTGSYQTSKLRSITLEAKKGAIFTQSSAELLADGLGFSDQLMLALRGAMSMGFDDSFINGDGVGKPVGIRNAGSLVQVSAETGQLAATVLYENLSKMWARMWAPCRARAVWICNDDCIPQLLQCSIPLSGVASGFYPVLREDSGQFYIFGKPVLFSPCMPTCGSENDILLVDLSQYAIGMRKELSIDRSIHVGFTQDLDTWRIICRFDGMPTWSSAVTPDNGSSQSWAVGLAARP